MHKCSLLCTLLCRLYGRALNIASVGVSCASGGFYFVKDPSKDFRVETLLSVQDPQDPSNDVAKSSWNIRVVRSAFDFAYQMLTAPSDPRESLLARIIHLQPVIAGRNMPGWEPPAEATSPWRNTYHGHKGRGGKHQHDVNGVDKHHHDDEDAEHAVDAGVHNGDGRPSSRSDRGNRQGERPQHEGGEVDATFQFPRGNQRNHHRRGNHPSAGAGNDYQPRTSMPPAKRRKSGGSNDYQRQTKSADNDYQQQQTAGASGSWRDLVGGNRKRKGSSDFGNSYRASKSPKYDKGRQGGSSDQQRYNRRRSGSSSHVRFDNSD